MGSFFGCPFNFTKKRAVRCLIQLVCRDVVHVTQIKKNANISVVDFNLAVNQATKTVYMPCMAWRELADTIAGYFQKVQMCVIIGEISNKLVTIKDSADRPQRYTKIEVIVHKIFFVDRNNKPANSATVEDWQKSEPQEFWDDDESDLPFKKRSGKVWGIKLTAFWG